jgi:hypothetical protein
MKLGRLNHIGIATPSIADSIVTLNSFQGPCLDVGRLAVRHGC